MENLEKSRNFKIFIFRAGKVMEKHFLAKSFGKVLEICYIHIYLRSLIYRIKMYIHIYSFNQTIVSFIYDINHSCIHRFHNIFGLGNLI